MLCAGYSQLVINRLEWWRSRILETVESADPEVGERRKKERKLDFSAITSVADPDLGSGIRYLFAPRIWDPE
jgi:hypothetical protein